MIRKFRFTGYNRHTFTHMPDQWVEASSVWEAVLLLPDEFQPVEGWYEREFETGWYYLSLDIVQDACKQRALEPV